MISTPVVSVLMPVYNSESYLEESIDSVLRQSFKDFELIVINDGSTDNSRIILGRYENADARIRVIDQENKGIIDALNRGLQLARGKYIARMDSDDVSFPDRLAKQVDFMDENPQVGACGTWVRYCGGSDGEWKTPTDSEIIRCRLLFESVLAHPTAIMRRSLFEKNRLQYRHGFEHAEDYDLWVRIGQYAKLANLPEVLLNYRVHSDQVVQRHVTAKINSANRIRIEQLQRLGMNLSSEEVALHNAISMWDFECSKRFMEAAETFLCKIIDANTGKSLYDASALLLVIAERWFALCYSNSALGMRSWHAFWQSSLSSEIHLTWEKKTKYLVRCLVRREFTHG